MRNKESVTHHCRDVNPVAVSHARARESRHCDTSHTSTAFGAFCFLRRTPLPPLTVSGVLDLMSTPWPTTQDGGEYIPSGSSSPDNNYARTPTTSHFDSPLLPPESPASKPPARSFSASGFVSSPLNPNVPHANTVRSRPASRGSAYFNRIASEESQALTAEMRANQRGSMVLYRLASDDGNDFLLPPKVLQQRNSVASSSGDSIFSLSSDSKYPSGMIGPRSGFVPYAYDPDMDTKDEGDEDDSAEKGGFGEETGHGFTCSTRGMLNFGVLLLLIGALLSLFVLYPVLNFYQTNGRHLAVDGNIRINSTGQAPVL